MNTIEKFAPGQEFNISAFHHYVRKNAHFFAYLLLGILALNALRKSKVSGYRGVGAALLICVLYAASDEFHQLFIPGRSGEVKDVLIDSTGAGVGIVIWIMIGWIAKRGKRVEV